MKIVLLSVLTIQLFAQSPIVLQLPVRGGQRGEIRFYSPNGSYQGFRSNTTGGGSNIMWNLPQTDGVGCLTSDGARNLSIVACSGGGGGTITINGLSGSTFTFATGTSGTDFNITQAVSTITLNIPSASGTNRGLVTSAKYTEWDSKENFLTFSAPLNRISNTIDCPTCVTGPATTTQNYFPRWSATNRLLVTGVEGTASASTDTIVMRDSSGNINVDFMTAADGFSAGESPDSDRIVGQIRRGTDTGPTQPILRFLNHAGGTLSEINASGNFTGMAAGLYQSLTQYAVILGNVAGVVAMGSLGTSGQCFTSNGAGMAPSWQACPGAGGGGVTGPGSSTVGFIPTWANASGTQIGTGLEVTQLATINAVAQRDGTGKLPGDVLGNAATATALAADPSGCTNQFVRDINASGTPTCAAVSLVDDTTGILEITKGGTGRSAFTAYALVAGGTGSTSQLQSLAGVGSTGQVLTSNGAGALPTWQTPAGGGNVNGPVSSIVGYAATWNNTTGTMLAGGWPITDAATASSIVFRSAGGTSSIDNLTSIFVTASNSVNTSQLVAGISPATDAIAAIIRRRTDSAPTTNIVEIRNQANSVNLAVVDKDGNWIGPTRDKGGEVFNVRAYGAVGDGATDDLTAINSAITAACTANGGHVFFPAGVYAVTGAIIIGNGTSSTVSTCNNVFLRGIGGARGVGNEGSEIRWTGSSPGTMAHIVTFNGPMEGGGVYGLRLNSNNIQNVGGVYLRQLAAGDFENVEVIKVNRAYGWEFNTINPSYGGTCYNNLRNVGTHLGGVFSGGSGFLMDGAAGYTSCSNQIFGGSFEFAAGQTDSVQYIYLTNAGSSCTGSPTVTITPVSGGSGAAATAYIVGGKVSGIRMTHMGSGYGADPTVSIGGLSCGVNPVAVALRTPMGARLIAADNNRVWGTGFSEFGTSGGSAKAVEFIQHAASSLAFPVENTFQSVSPSRTFGSIGTTGINAALDIKYDDCGGVTCLSTSPYIKTTWNGRYYSNATVVAEAVAWDIPTTQRWPIWSVNNIGSTSEAGCFGYRADNVTFAKTCYFEQINPSDVKESQGGLKLYLRDGGVVQQRFNFWQNGLMTFNIGYDLAILDLQDWPDGTIAYCTNCVPGSGTSTCSTGGTGAFAGRLNSGWRCF